MCGGQTELIAGQFLDDVGRGVNLGAAYVAKLNGRRPVDVNIVSAKGHLSGILQLIFDQRAILDPDFH